LYRWPLNEISEVLLAVKIASLLLDQQTQHPGGDSIGRICKDMMCLPALLHLQKGTDAEKMIPGLSLLAIWMRSPIHTRLAVKLCSLIL
jgi:hypothetical protein